MVEIIRNSIRTEDILQQITMKYLIVLACVLAAALAENWGYHWGQGGNSGNWNWNAGGNQNHNQGNFLQQLLQAHMGQNNNGGHWGQQGGQQWGNMGGQRPQSQGTMTNNVLGSLLGNILGSVLMTNMRGGNMGDYRDRDDDKNYDEDRKDELSKMEELLKKSMATEMFDLMRAYNTYKDNEEEFQEAMKHLCYMVDVVWTASKEHKFEVYNVTSDDTLKEMESSSKGMSEDEKMEAAVDILMNETQLFNELFFRMASWSCWAGHEYLESAIKLDKLHKGDKCGD